MDADLALPSLQVLFEEGIRRFPDLSFTLGVCNLGACLSIARKDLHCHPPAGLLSLFQPRNRCRVGESQTESLE